MKRNVASKTVVATGDDDGRSLEEGERRKEERKEEGRKKEGRRKEEGRKEGGKRKEERGRRKRRGTEH